MGNLLPTDYQNFIALSRYARWKDDEQRRENWDETVSRYFDYVGNYVNKKFNFGEESFSKIRKNLEESVLNLDVMPSMRAMMTASGSECQHAVEQPVRDLCLGQLRPGLRLGPGRDERDAVRVGTEARAGLGHVIGHEQVHALAGGLLRRPLQRGFRWQGRPVDRRIGRVCGLRELP